MDPATFLEHYGFELEGQPSQVWVERWSQLFPDLWIPAALLEALYQGRYKAASVEQLLRLWQRGKAFAAVLVRQRCRTLAGCWAFPLAELGLVRSTWGSLADSLSHG
jgi:hypothetical protein